MGVKNDKHGKVLAALKMSELESLLNTIPKKRRHLVIHEIEKRKSAKFAAINASSVNHIVTLLIADVESSRCE